jgi:hypothetical protein
MDAVRRVRIGVLGVAAVLVVALWAWFLTVRQGGRREAVEHGALQVASGRVVADTPSGRSGVGRSGVAPRRSDPAGAWVPRSLGMPRELPPEPDLPAGASPYSPEFEDQLLRAAQANGRGTPEEACIEWGRTLPLSLAEGASRAEFEVGLANVADACTRPGDAPRSDHDLRLAHEALRRYAELEPRAEAELEAFTAKYPEQARTRASLLFVERHRPGTAVALDGQPGCIEPCTLAVPIDGQPHQLDFTGPNGRSAHTIWTPNP